MFANLPGMWMTKDKTGKIYYSIVRSTNNPNLYTETTGKSMRNLDIINGQLKIQYKSKKYQGHLQDDKIIWSNVKNGAISSWKRVKWVDGAQHLKGNFMAIDSLFNVRDFRGRVSGISYNNDSPVFTLFTKENKVIHVPQLKITEPQSLTNHRASYGYPSHLCKYM